MIHIKHKKRNSGRDSHQSDENYVPQYAPHTGLRPIDFHPTQAQISMDAEFSATVEKFLSSAKPDPYIRPFMDAKIEASYRKALKQLRIQHIDHLSTLKNSLSKLIEADKIKAEARLESAKLQLAEVEAQLLRYENNTDGGIPHEKS